MIHVTRIVYICEADNRSSEEVDLHFDSRKSLEAHRENLLSVFKQIFFTYESLVYTYFEVDMVIII